MQKKMKVLCLLCLGGMLRLFAAEPGVSVESDRFHSEPVHAAKHEITENRIRIEAKESGRGTVCMANRFSVKELTPYRLHFRYRTEGDVNRLHLNPLRITVRFQGDTAAMKAAGYETECVMDFPPSETEKEISTDGLRVLAPFKAISAEIEIAFSGAGSVVLDRPELSEIPFPNDVIRTKNQIWQRTRKKTDPPIKLTEEEVRQGSIVYQREPSKVFPESTPSRDEICSELRKFTVPGEYTSIPFVVFTHRDGVLNSFTVSDLRTPDGAHMIPGKDWEVFHVPFRKKPAWSNRYYFVIPEVLYPFEKTVFTKGGNMFLWMRIRLPKNTVPGFYYGTVHLKGDAFMREIPVQLRVLPFLLEQPKADWMMYGGNFWAGGWQNNRRKDIQKKHFEEIASLGQTGMLHHGGIYTEQQAKEFCEYLDGAGMHGPLVIDFGWQLEATVYKKLYGKNLSDHRKFPYPECSDPKVAEGFINHLKDLDSWMKKYFKGSAWYYQGLDEPHIYGGLSQAAWEYPLAKKAGVRTSSTVYPYREFTAFGKWGLDVSVNSMVKFSAKENERLMEASKKQNTALWLLGPGCYVPGTGINNRYQAGFLFWKTGLSACVSWTYGAGADRDELEYGKMNYYTVYARKDFQKSEPVENPVKYVCSPTLLSEGLREGVTDYKYVWTLEQFVRRAKEQGKSAERAERLLFQLKHEMTPYWNEIDKNGTMDEPAMERMRWAVAYEIIRLQEFVK